MNYLNLASWPVQLLIRLCAAAVKAIIKAFVDWMRHRNFDIE